MRVTAMPLAGAFTVEGDEAVDERGSFLRVFCQREFRAHGLPPTFVQTSISRNRLRGTLRGLHFQAAPRAEGKLVRCIRGSLYDVIVDLRPESPSYLRWHAVELHDERDCALYIPPGLAHGFQTLADGTDVLYHITDFYVPELARGVRWNDPAFAVDWPLPVAVMSERDRALPDFRP